MTKEEKIKEAWGVYFEHFGEHATKHALENNGYCSVPSITLGLILRRYGEEWLETNKDLKKRPKSLQGIETNNGWIKIESEEDLPKEKCDLLVCPEFENQFVFHFYNDKKCKEALMQNHTHYQPIVKPLKPIY